jgi:hypothetical protein
MYALAALLLVALLPGPASADIVTLNGLVQITAPSIVTGDFLIADNLPAQVIFPESKGVTLVTDLVTDTSTIPAGTAVDSYWVA